jgi:putative membrane protein
MTLNLYNLLKKRKFKNKKKKIKINMRKKKKENNINLSLILLYLKGALMGLFDLVPGISGGTMALITGIYKDLIREINNFFKLINSIIKFNKQKINTTWKDLNKKFLIILILGIITGIIISVIAMSFLLNNYFAQTLGTITGIILIASIKLIKENVRAKKTFIIGLAGLIIGILLSVITPMAGHDFSFIQIFFLGAITITAMILPGISGALILLLLGGYEFMINALRNIQAEYLTVIIFMTGAIIGLGFFSKTITYLLKEHHDETMAFLSCLMLGAITKPIIEIMHTNNPVMAVPFFFAGAIITYFIYKKIQK